MTPSILFWLDLSANLISAFIALFLFFHVLSVGLRQRLGQTFNVFVASVATTSLCFSLARIALWRDFGDPLFWSELATAGFYFIGPTLLAFALVYTDSKAHRYTVTVLVGLVVGSALIPPLFNHQIISRAYLDHGEYLGLQITEMGNAATAGSLLFQALALVILWQHRRQSVSLTIALGTTFLIWSGVFGFLLHAPLPAFSFTFAIGILIIGYDVMNRQLFNPLWALTQRLNAEAAQRDHELQQLNERLHRLNEGYRRVNQISREIAQINESTAMLIRVVGMIHAYLGYHHVYIYTPDKTNQKLVVRAAAGTTARTVMRKGHQLETGAHSLAGKAAVEHRPRYAEARGEDAVYFEDTALPGARSEIALPLLVGDRLLGVLDLQSIHFGAFSDEDAIIMTSLTDQLAVLLDNALLHEKAKTTLAELDNIQRQYLRQAWGSTSDRSDSLPAYIYTDSGGVMETSLTAAWSPEISQAATQGQILLNDREEKPSTVVLPIALRDQVIGALQVRHKAGRAWQPEDIDTLVEVVERLGLALETARLSEENQRRAAREQLISEITARMHETLDVETVLQTAAREMGKALGLQDVTIRLEMENDQIG